MSTCSQKHIIEADVVIEVDADTVYYGFANPGTATSAAGWSILKETTSTPSGLLSQTVRQWADGSKKFDKVLDNYVDYSY